MAELVGVRLGLPLLRILIADLRVSYVDAFGISASVYTEGRAEGVYYVCRLGFSSCRAPTVHTDDRANGRPR